MRSARCPPSRVSINDPSALRSNSAPRRISSRSRVGPSSTSTRTAAGSHRPTPAISVSEACMAGVSVGSRTAAMPPCAHLVDPSSMSTLVTTVTCSPASRRCNAAVSPATPEPTTITSVVSTQPGAGAASRVGNAGRPTVGRSMPPVNPNALRLGRRGRDEWFRLLRPHRQCRRAGVLERSGHPTVAEPQIAADPPVADPPPTGAGRRTTTSVRKIRSSSSGTPAKRARTERHPA